MIEFIVRGMIEHATSCRPHEIQSMHNSSLQVNARLMEMLAKSSPARCHRQLEYRGMCLLDWERNRGPKST